MHTTLHYMILYSLCSPEAGLEGEACPPDEYARYQRAVYYYRGNINNNTTSIISSIYIVMINIIMIIGRLLDHGDLRVR